MTWANWHKALLALCLWREARGEGVDGMRAVGHVVRNRVLRGDGDWAHVLSKKWQFSSLTAPGDPQLTLWPTPPDEAFDDAQDIASRIYNDMDFDLTSGSLYYFNPDISIPTWAASLTFVVKIGHHEFFR